MNNAGRKRLVEAIGNLEAEVAEMVKKLDDLKSVAEELRDEEQEKFDNLSEGLQQSERGQNIQEAVDQLDTMSSNLDSAIDALGELTFDVP